MTGSGKLQQTYFKPESPTERKVAFQQNQKWMTIRWKQDLGKISQLLKLLLLDAPKPGLPDFFWRNIPKRGEIYQNSTK
jgi:hypothetical protein